MPLEYPPQSYWPSAKATLSIRFDEFGYTSGRDIQKIRTMTPITKVVGNKDPRGTLQVVDDPTAPGGTKRFLLVPPTTATNRSTFGGANADVDRFTHDIAGIIPRRAVWKQNGIRIADTLEMDIRWVDMPLDPRIIRSCAVSFYLGSLSPDQFARGVQGETRESDHQPLNLLPDSYVDVRGTVRTNLRFTGWADKWKMNWSDGEPVISLECTDNTRLLLKQPQPSKGSISDTKPIDEAIADYLKQFPQLAGISVEYRPSELSRSEIPVLKKVLAGSAYAPDLGPPNAVGGGEDDSVWDYLDVITGAIGHTIRLDGTRIIIQRATSLLDGRAAPRADDPYRERVLPSGTYPVRAFVWGRNIADMTVSHEYTRREAKGVELRCYSPARKKTLVARFPEGKEDRPVHPLPGGKGDQHWQVVRVQGVNDQDTLKRIAEDYYNNLFRNELKIDLKTINMASFGGGYNDTDLLDMKAGDNFQILIDRGNDSIQGQIEEDLSDSQRMVKRLRSMGYSEDFANAAAAAYTDAGFQRVFRLKEMSCEWDTDEGVRIMVGGINYVETRVDAPLDDGTTVPTGKK